ncbi:hypothetical protein [Vibrio atypicus]|uniref:hypothetical protein n=1 Tax=Vibrio atypicus TaxID=558271 RepID=UPI0013576600|nr:hypothetical protein [Vibrio atypicus]
MIKFWNGNKSPARQAYEYELLECLLEDSGMFERIDNDVTDYSCAEDEGAVLDKGADILVTVAGNSKFLGKRLIEIKQPLCRGLLGWRLCIVDQKRVDEFCTLSLRELQQKRVGVPDSWVDAELFRANGFDVVESGTLDDMLDWVADGTVDFITLGANEAEDILSRQTVNRSGLVIEPTLAIFYPFPLVFYLNQHQSMLAERLCELWDVKKAEISELFDKHYGSVIEQAKLDSRKRLTLQNPLLPDDYEALFKFSFE